MVFFNSNSKTFRFTNKFQWEDSVPFIEANIKDWKSLLRKYSTPTSTNNLWKNLTTNCRCCRSTDIPKLCYCLELSQCLRPFVLLWSMWKTARFTIYCIRKRLNFLTLKSKASPFKWSQYFHISTTTESCIETSSRTTSWSTTSM